VLTDLVGIERKQGMQCCIVSDEDVWKGYPRENYRLGGVSIA